MEIASPYLVFLGAVPDHAGAKTGYGLVDWCPEKCLGQLRLPGCVADLALPDLTVAEAARAGARTLVIGIAHAGGRLPASWTATIVEALEAGLDVASGMHERLGSNPEIEAAAARSGRKLFDVRHTTHTFDVGSGQKRSGRRVLTVGTDCAVGKKYTALALAKEMRARAIDAAFCATGQTGILIAGRGVAIDAVVADFISGAAEFLSPAKPAQSWDIIEGQGSLFHPSYAGVTLGLLHGAQPDLFVVCHDPARGSMRGTIGTKLPSIQEVIDLTVRCGRLTNPAIAPLGLSINTKSLPEDAARRYLAELEAEHKLPAVDPVRFGVAPLVDALPA